MGRDSKAGHPYTSLKDMTMLCVCVQKVSDRIVCVQRVSDHIVCVNKGSVIILCVSTKGQ